MIRRESYSMINEERVKELYHMAVYDSHMDKVDSQIGQYYIWDYIGKELVRSFFTGTAAYVLIAVLWGMNDLEAVTARINNLDVVDLGVRAGILYAGFLAVYLLATAAVYLIRYAYGRKKLRRYAVHLKRVRKMYQREDKLRT